MSNLKSTLSKMFCLDGLLLDRIEDSAQEINLRVRSPRTQAICPHCIRTTKTIHRHKTRRIKHASYENKLVNLLVTLRHFRCRHCASLFQEKIPGIDRRRTSVHFRQSWIPKIRDRSFSAVAADLQISSSSIIRASRELASEIGIRWPGQSFALGLDEHSFSGSDLMTTATDVINHDLISILTDDRQETVRRFVQNIPQNTRNLITCACIDIKTTYLSVIEQELPGKPIVVDKFHVIQFCNQQLRDLRSIYTAQSFRVPKKLLETNREDLKPDERQMLKQIFRRFPSLEELWRLKEFVRTMYRIKDPFKAADRYQSLLDGLDGDPRARWQTLYRTFKRWQKYILNYFTYRVTNAYTEGVNTRIKLLKRISYGFRNKLNYIAKMTLAFLPLTALLSLIHSSPSST